MTISPYIKSIGVELECGVPTAKQAAYEAEMKSRFGDHFEKDSDATAGGGNPSTYEQEMEYKYWSENWEDIEEFLKLSFNKYKIETSPTYKVRGVEHSNHTNSGMHMHFRTNPDMIPMKEAVALASYEPFQKEFIDEYKAEYRNKPKYYNRINNSWSKSKYDEDEVREQLEYTSIHHSSRYHAVNLNAYNLHGNLEIRILPQADSAEEAITALHTQVKMLDKVFKKNKELGEELVLESNEYNAPNNMKYSKEELEAYKDALETEDVNVRMRE